MRTITIQGARQHNLKNISLSLPRERLVVITGLSGSGKSSLAFDTLYAEGQRRYVDSLSPYARQFLDLRAKPDVDAIDGLSPTISIEQKQLSKNPRSTVGTVTEIHDYLRLLYARIGAAYCPRCETPIRSLSVQQMVDRVLSLGDGARLSILAPLARGATGGFGAELEGLRRKGFVRVNIDGDVRDLAESITLDPEAPHQIDVYVDRLVLKRGIRARISDSLELALSLSDGLCTIAPVDGDDFTMTSRLSCLDCGAKLPELSPRLFSFNSPQGACPRCSGLGVLLEFDEERIVPDGELSLREGAIEPWDQKGSQHYQQVLEALAEHAGFSVFAPYHTLDEAARALVMHGSGASPVAFSFDDAVLRHRYRKPFEGVIPHLQRRLDEAERKRRSATGADGKSSAERVLAELYRYMRRSPCPACNGSRLCEEARFVRVGGASIDQVSRKNIAEAIRFFSELSLPPQQQTIAARMLKEIAGRLSFLASVGVDYLTLDRAAGTLSGGEGQRVRLATQIGASLVGVLYVLDEPSVGLHPRDQERLLGTLCKLRDLGNSVLLVEHDEQTIRAADYVVDMGPGAGSQGGEVVAAGTLDEIMAVPASVTGQYLSGQRSIDVPSRRRRARGHLVLQGASANNLCDVDLKLPLGVLTCVTGVSGSGKSSLLIDTLLPALRRELHRASDVPGPYCKLTGVHQLDKVIAIDQAPIGRTPRSNPATYIGVFGRIRELFAGLAESKARGYRSGRYSFNVKGGRCEACQGDGTLRIAMHFLPDIYVECDVCGGKRYDRETLEVQFKGHSIADVLALTATDALKLLGAVPAIAVRLQALCDVGLGYLSLGQAANTLSGGEAQRLKLSRELGRRATGRTLYMMDEPTTGLHIADIHVLLEVLDRLVAAGNTVVIIEHQLDVIKCADHIIDLGPEGGAGGGRIVASGTPEQLAATAGSHTGACLRAHGGC